MDWSNGKVGIKVSRETGRRNFYLLKTERAAGGAEKTTRQGLRERYPTMRIPSTKQIMRKQQERAAGRAIQLRIFNDTKMPVFIGFYDRIGSGIVERRGEIFEIPAKSRSATLEGPEWLFASRQYVVAGLHNPGDFPDTARLSVFGDRAIRIGWNLRVTTFTVKGVSLHTLIFD